MEYRPLPVGIDDFEKIITKEYYYVDKTWFIKELLDKKGEVNLFTRPRRFGKTLNQSMLKCFFEKPKDGKDKKHLFDGLKIMDAGEKYTKEQQQYPVIMLTLKSAKQPTWELAYASLVDDIANEFKRHSEILDSNRMLEADQKRFIAIRDRKAEGIDYAKSLAFLSQCLSTVYEKKTIILIDEYDVPLENAYYAGFYNEMIGFIRSLFESALKTNPFLEFSVITGCLRISKESIFTGMNNLKIISMLNDLYSEHFGFTEKEVVEMLAFYQLNDHMGTVKEWYDGYVFGDTEVYNPWSVIHYVDQHWSNREAFPTAAWSNSSSNSIVKDLVYRADTKVKDEIEILMNGGSIEKQVHEDITYEDIYTSEENLWNFLFFTGYLKAANKRMEMDDIYLTLTIPNREVRSIYRNSISNWFRDEIKEQDLSLMYASLLDGNASIFEAELNRQLQRMISYMDEKEAFYHGFLLGVLNNMSEYIVKSNREAGNGRLDICVRSNDVKKTPVILELKVAQKVKQLEASVDAALEQIKVNNYDEYLSEMGYTEVLHVGLGFFAKQVCVKMIRQDLD